MRFAIFDPPSNRHDYLTAMYLNPFREWTLKNGHSVWEWTSLTQHSNSIVLTLADNLNLDTVNQLKNNNCKIVGFSVTDSSYISQSCREAAVLSKIDLMFMLTGIQKVNTGKEFVVDKDFNIKMEDRQFLPDEDWQAFNLMRVSGRLKSLPYVHWERQPHVEAKPYNLRSQKALIRGGHHMRRFILALKLMQRDLLDVNSGFVTEAYFQDNMNPQFRYCDRCRTEWKKNRMYPYKTSNSGLDCPNPMWKGTLADLSDLGAWNNRCPESFYQAARHFGFIGNDLLPVEKLLNARWLPAHEHLAMLARITFTTDLKWLFSIYAAQRFWDAAMVGCINVLPDRTRDQDYFPVMEPNVHYVTFDEGMNFLAQDFILQESDYNNVSKAALALYNQWMRPSEYSISTNLLRKIFQDIEAIQ